MEDIMKKKMAAFLAVSILLCGQALAADFSNLVIIHTNDTHGFDRRAEGNQRYGHRIRPCVSITCHRERMCFL